MTETTPFTPLRAAKRSTEQHSQPGALRATYDVVIVGAGFSGLGMANALEKDGMDYVVLEQASDVGGTWLVNRYPGAGCDIQSHLYSFSFAPHAGWSEAYAKQPEILDYLVAFAKERGLRSRIQFNASVVSVCWNELHCRWHIALADGRKTTASVLILGNGGLSRPAVPLFTGLDSYKGETIHTARWPAEVSLQGKTVAVIGTGASAIQLVPAIVDEAKSIKLFQRTPAWVLPKSEMKFPTPLRKAFRSIPMLRSAFRAALYWQLESRVLGFAYEPRLLHLLSKVAATYIRSQVVDPQLAARLVPDYTLGCKRILLSDDYLSALQRPNVELITEPIHHVSRTGIVTASKRELAADVLIFATGFQVGDYNASPFEIIGREGRLLSEVWREGPEAYLGTAVHGFPNLFFMVGPNTGLGHNSMILMIESHIAYLADCVRKMRRRRSATVEVREDAQNEFNAELRTRFRNTVWTRGGCRSWYSTSEGKNTALWPGSTYEFRRRTASFDDRSYHVTTCDNASITDIT